MMKKWLFSLIMVIGCASFVKADAIKFDLGRGLIVDLPFSEVDGLALWNFKNKVGLGGAETPLISYKKFQFTGGAVTSVSGRGAPFVRTYLLLPNPIGNFASFEALKPGIFVGRDFNANQYIFGLAASLPIW